MNEDRDEHDILLKAIDSLEERISRLERIIKKGLDFEHPEISEEIKDL